MPAFGVISPPPRRAATMSLVNAAVTPDAGTVQVGDQRWELGFSFRPDACSDADIFDPCNVTPPEYPPLPAFVDYSPFGVRGADRCSTIGVDQAEYERRARSLLERCESKQIATELWEGNLFPGNPHLAGPGSDTVTNGPAGAVEALACLEQALADSSCGARGMIHANRQVVTHWAALGNSVLRREGGLLLTVHDTIVVSDAGYTGTGPNGEPAANSQWAYATGLVTVLRSPVMALPGTLAEAIDVSVSSDNTVQFLAQRLAAAAWDGCAWFAAELDLAACSVGGAS